MTLDFVHLAPRLDELIARLDRDRAERSVRFARAERLLEAAEDTQLDTAVRSARNTNWLLARPCEPLNTRRTAPRGLPPYAALATDGSSIDVSRHAPTACYVINIGHAWLDYARSSVDLGSTPELEFAEERLLRGDSANASKESVMTGNLLDAYRTAQEMLRLAELAEQHTSAGSVVALLDGQFVLWGLKETELSSQAREAIFDRGVMHALDRLREVAAGGRLALGSYISRPGGRELTNALRVAYCPRPGGADCRDCPRRGDGSRPCDDVAGGTDADLFAHFLDEGERSAILARSSAASDLAHADSRYAASGHAMRFFYLRVRGGEVVRIEMPEWVAESDAAVGLLHTAVLDQCERGGGYPLVLQEAHEQAVIDGAARRSFSLLLDRQMEEQGSSFQPSGKSWSKRRRPI